MKRLADILLSLAALLLLAACTDDADVYNTPASSEGNLCVYVPVTREGDEVKSSLDPSNPTYNASVEECQINDLHLYAFPVGSNGTFLSQELPSPEASNMINEKVASYQLKIKPGTYRVYVVANMKDVLDVNSITTEGDLKKVVLSYIPPTTKPGMPVATNIPMIYEPETKAADGTATDTITINNTDKTPKIVAANLRFTCVKVCLNLIYDPNATGVSSALKNGMIINDVKAERLSPSTNLLWDGMFSNSSVSDDYAKGFVSTLYDNASTATGNGLYYSDWTETPANANVNDQNIISVKSVGTAKPVDTKQKWLFRATYYLPERYVAKAAQQSALKIGGAVGDHKNSYNINLGHRQDETSKTEVPTFPRGTYYEIVGRIKSLGNIDLDCVVGVKPWEMETIDADFTHTTLWVSKTSAKLKSLQDDYIDYKTNADPASLKVVCESKVNKTTLGDLEIIKVENDPVNKRLKFFINPALSVTDFGLKTEGDAKVSIKVNNLKKYLYVHYNVTPYFNVDPVDIVIFYDEHNTAELTKSVNFTTNLGGIKFPDGWSVLDSGHDVTYANSTINIKCKNTQLAKGTFTITAKTDPKTTTTHTFTVKSIDAVKDAANKDIYKEQEIRVTVRPPKGKYFIYMRAINDLAWALNASTLEQFDHSEMLDEEAYNNSDQNNNWRDGWWVEGGAVWGTDFSSHKDYHKVYIYTQKGETNADGTKDENVAEWYFTGGWPGSSMTPDNNNPGWYYYSIAHDAKSESNNGQGDAKTTPQKTIKPGQTLLIFNNGTYTDVGFQPHRFTHHNDPGITLFNYEDREGWYLYDPLSDPYYTVYDEKPTVVDVEYTIYTKRHGISGWYCIYGVNSKDGKGKFEMKSNSCNVPNQFDCTKCDKKDKDGNTWYKTILHLKAPLNEYAKVLHVKISNTADEPELFDGDNYPVSGTVTRTINGRKYVRYVIEGSYDPDTDTWKQGAPF